jgi:L-alanine-DL-glutamate epimerase-like enolase superfamily enzyme
VLGEGGTMAVPTGPGLGVEPRPERLAACTRRVERVSR